MDAVLRTGAAWRDGQRHRHRQRRTHIVAHPQHLRHGRHPQPAVARKIRGLRQTRRHTHLRRIRHCHPAFAPRHQHLPHRRHGRRGGNEGRQSVQHDRAGRPAEGASARGRGRRGACPRPSPNATTTSSRSTKPPCARAWTSYPRPSEAGFPRKKLKRGRISCRETRPSFFFLLSLQPL